MNILINLLLAVHIIVCLLMVIAVLMQRPKNEGLGAAFGGGMTESLFGAQTTNVLATITRWLGVLFFGLTLLLSALYARQGRSTTGVQQKLNEAAKAAEPATPAVAPVAPAAVPTEEKKTDAPAVVPATEAPKTPEVKPESVPAPAPAPVEKAPVPSEKAPESTKADSEKDAAPILKVSAPELNPSTPAPAPAAPEPKSGESAQ